MTNRPTWPPGASCRMKHNKITSLPIPHMLQQFPDQTLNPIVTTTPNQVILIPNLTDLQALHRSGIHTRQIPKCTLDPTVCPIDHQWPFLCDIPPVSVFPLSSPDMPWLGGLLHVLPCPKLLQQVECVLGPSHPFHTVIHHHWHLSHVCNLMASGHQQWWQRWCCNCRHHCISTHVQVCFPVPFPPWFCGVKHPSSSAHIPKGSLTSAMGSAARHTRNSGHCPTSSPGFCRSLVACLVEYRVRLPGILQSVVVHPFDDIWANGRLEDGWQWDLLTGGIAVGVIHSNQRSGSGHDERCTRV